MRFIISLGTLLFSFSSYAELLNFNCAKQKGGATVVLLDIDTAYKGSQIVATISFLEQGGAMSYRDGEIQHNTSQGRYGKKDIYYSIIINANNILLKESHRCTHSDARPCQDDEFTQVLDRTTGVFVHDLTNNEAIREIVYCVPTPENEKRNVQIE